MNTNRTFTAVLGGLVLVLIILVTLLGKETMLLDWNDNQYLVHPSLKAAINDDVPDSLKGPLTIMLNSCQKPSMMCLRWQKEFAITLAPTEKAPDLGLPMCKEYFPLGWTEVDFVPADANGIYWKKISGERFVTAPSGFHIRPTTGGIAFRGIKAIRMSGWIFLMKEDNTCIEKAWPDNDILTHVFRVTDDAGNRAYLLYRWGYGWAVWTTGGLHKAYMNNPVLK